MGIWYEHTTDYPDFTAPEGLSAPTLESVSVVGSNSMLPVWTSVAEATGYKVKYGTETGVYTTEIDVGDTTSYVVAGLLKGVTYYFVVSAYNDTLQSDNSNELSETIAITPVNGTTYSAFTEYSVGSDGVPYSVTRGVSLFLDPITGTYSARLSLTNQEERVQGIEIARITQEDQSFLARAGYLQT